MEDRKIKKIILFFLTAFLITFCFTMEGWSNSKMKSMDPALDQESIYWYEKGVKKRAWMALDEAAIFLEKGKEAEVNQSLMIQQLHPQATITEKNNFIIYLKTPELIGKELILRTISSIRTLQGVKHASQVFYTSKEKHPETRLVLTGEIIVQFPTEYSESQISAIEKEYGFEQLKSFGFSQNTFLYRVGNTLNSLDVANHLYESGLVNYAYPNWLRGRTKRATPNDPLFPDQWHLKNTGQEGGTAGEDANVTSVWDTYQTSSSEVVAIVDDGLEIGHEDLTDNVIAGQSWDYVDGDSDPTAGDHGSSCAGVAAGRGFNGIGITGAAPFAGLVGHRLLDAGTDANEADALTRNSELIDIYSNSWGPSDDGSHLEGPGPLTEDALENGVTNGRGALGSIYVWAGGNGYDTDNSNYDGYANSRYTIAVAASTNYGDRAEYSEKGANILVNAPSSGGSLEITTTDRTGVEGYDPSNYTNSFGGTSSASPLVSGIIALMLQANPDLTWRDVQHILIETADQNNSTDADWTTNGAGYHVNHKYGFGRVDAQAAADLALSWTSVSSETSIQASSSPNSAIPDNDQEGVTDTISISEDITAEFVEIYFTAADHTYWGDLEITLTSPAGTESVLSESHFSRSAYVYDNWRFGSVRHFGESSQGSWTLRVRDLYAIDTGTFQSWTLIIYGTSVGENPITHTLTSPSNTTVSQGSLLGPFYTSVTNNTSSSYPFYIYPYIGTPDGNWILMFTNLITLAAGETSWANDGNGIYLMVPYTAQTGTTYHCVNIYDTSYNLIDQDCFSFEVTSSSSSAQGSRNYQKLKTLLNTPGAQIHEKGEWKIIIVPKT
jgi:kexin